MLLEYKLSKLRLCEVQIVVVLLLLLLLYLWAHSFNLKYKTVYKILLDCLPASVVYNKLTHKLY